MGMVLEKMNNLMTIKEKLISQLKEKKCLPIASETLTDTKITLTMDSCVPLSITIDKDEMVVTYANEHDNFLRSPCKSDDEWIYFVCSLVSKISNYTIVFSYVHVKSVLISYKIMVRHQDGTNEILKKVTVSSNPFLRFFKKEKTFKEITFFKQ